MATANDSIFIGIPGFSASPATPPPAAWVTTEAAPRPRRWASRPQLESSRKQRSRRARRATRFATRIEVVEQDQHGVRVLSRHDIEGGNIEEAIAAAVEEVSLRMTPLSEEEKGYPGNKGYSYMRIANDVVLYWRSTVIAVVTPTADGPMVHRFFHPSVPTQR